MCVQLFVSTIKPVPLTDDCNGGSAIATEGGADWSDEARRAFRKLARNDIPFTCKVQPSAKPFVLSFVSQFSIYLLFMLIYGLLS